jgi:hypothetical protein
VKAFAEEVIHIQQGKVVSGSNPYV